MPRRERQRQNPLHEALNKVKQRLRQSPFAFISQRFEEVAVALQQDLQHGFVSRDAESKLSGSIDSMLDLLPQLFGEKFWFDVGMISALAEEWSQGHTQLSGTIFPKPYEEWGHTSISLPTYGHRATYVIDLILIPGNNRLEDVDLLAYPFLNHELGHNALFKYDTIFPQSFWPVLEQYTNSLRRQSLADRGAARRLAHDTVDMIHQLWSPTANHYNWAHELAMDVIALWTAGPAYLATFQDTLEDEERNPYQVGQSHPHMRCVQMR